MLWAVPVRPVVAPGREREQAEGEDGLGGFAEHLIWGWHGDGAIAASGNKSRLNIVVESLAGRVWDVNVGARWHKDDPAGFLTFI